MSTETIQGMQIDLNDLAAAIRLRSDTDGWTLHHEAFMGSVFWTRKVNGNDLYVYATPDWDGADGEIPWHTDDEDGIIARTGCESWPIAGRTIDGYVATMIPILRAVARAARR